MSDNTQMLEYIYEGAEMGRDSISQLIKNTEDVQFRRALESQQSEYQSVMDEADKMMRASGVKPDGVGMMAKVSSQVMTSAKTMMDSSVTNMAEMMIQGSTMGVTKMTRHLNELQGIDGDVHRLSQKLLDTEQNNIEQMKKYL